MHTGTVTHPNSKGTEAPARWNLPDLALSVSSSGCSSVSFITSFNKLTNVTVGLSFSITRQTEVHQHI